MESEMQAPAPVAVRVVEAHSGPRLEEARALFREYAAALDIDLCFQNFDQELAQLPGKYAPPHGGLWVAVAGEQPAGCVGFRPLAPDICELKRLYVRPAFRHAGAGRTLAERALASARAAGYRLIRLDSLASMKEAIALYRSLGFRHAAPYCDNPSPHAVFMELAFRPENSGQHRSAD